MDQFTWPRQAQYMVHFSSSSFSSCLGLGLGWEGEWLDQFTWPCQTQYMVYFSSSSFSSCHNIMSISLLDLYYSGAINRLKSTLRGARQYDAVLALRPSDKSLSTDHELWILLASWHVTLNVFVASTMRTCLLTTCALALAPGVGVGIGVGICKEVEWLDQFQ